MLTTKQIQILQIAMKAAGLRKTEAGYKLYLMQFKDRWGRAITSSKQLTPVQFETILGDCVDLGWVNTSGYKFNRQCKATGCITPEQRSMLGALRAELVWNECQLAGMATRVCSNSQIHELTIEQAQKLIEALKAMLARQRGCKVADLNITVKQPNEANYSTKPQENFLF